MEPIRTLFAIPSAKLSEVVSDTKLYIASVKWNGKPWTRAWFTHEELMAGRTLELVMTDKPVHWDTGAPPPSRAILFNDGRLLGKGCNRPRG